MIIPKYNIVWNYCKIDFYLKFSVTNYDVADSESGTWHILYKVVCCSLIT